MLVVLVGCSFGVARIPDRPPASRFPEDERFECGIVFAPILDTTVSLGLAAFVATRELDFMPDPMAGPLENAVDFGLAEQVFELENTLMLLTSATAFASAFYGYTQAIRCNESRLKFEADRAKRVAERKALAARRDEASRLTKTAASAARSERCADVQRFALDISRLDREFFEVVFARDVAIARCLALPSQPASSIPSQPSPGD